MTEEVGTPRSDAARDFTAPEKIYELSRQLERELIQSQESLRKALAREEWIWGNCDVQLQGHKTGTIMREAIQYHMPREIWR